MVEENTDKAADSAEKSLRSQELALRFVCEAVLLFLDEEGGRSMQVSY